jgi:hypothetical protein
MSNNITNNIILNKNNKNKINKIIQKWHKFGFPYVKYFINPNIMFNLLKNTTHNNFKFLHKFISYNHYQLKERFNIPKNIDIRFRNQYISIFIPLEDFTNMDLLVDYFTENSRIKAKLRPSNKSLYNHYTNGDLIQKSILKLIDDQKPINIKNIRDVFYEFKYIYNASPESTLFYLTMLSIIFNFKSDLSNLIIIDGAGGYGTRLLTSIILNCNYIGVEPNTMSYSGFNNMINDFGNINKQKMLLDGLPYAKDIIYLPDLYSDIIMFSPPLFDGEIYSNNDKQSIKMFPSFNDWKYNFLFKSINLLWSKLKINGFAIFQSMRYDYINEFMLTLPNAKFIGVISRKTYAGRFKPNWIWTKIF